MEVTVTCPCGTAFVRPVKRGRPQVWCGSCRQVPFYERVAVVSKPEASDIESGIEAEPGKSPEQLRRERIEAAVIELNARWKTEVFPQAATMFAETELVHDGFYTGPELAARRWYDDQMAAIYAANPRRGKDDE